MTPIKQPFQCNLQPEIQEPHRSTHTDTTTRCKTPRRNNSRMKRPQPHPPHTHTTNYLSSPAAATLHGKTQGFVLRLPPELTTCLRRRFPSSPLPFLTTPLHHHFPSSPLPFLTTSHRHRFPSSPLPFLTTSHCHPFPSSPLPIVSTLHQGQFHRFLLRFCFEVAEVLTYLIT